MQTMRVFILMAGLTALLAGIGGMVYGQGGAIVFFLFAGVMNFGMYWFSDRMVLRMYRARIIERKDAPDLYDMIDRLRQRANLPMPVVAIAPSQQPNAFATGRNAEHAVICCTAGLLQLVSKDELEGVLAHELGHVRHHHMLIGTMAATMAGAVAMVGRVIGWGLMFGMGGGRDRDNGGNLFGMLAAIIVAPIAAMILQMAISRQNEFQADRAAAEISGRPLALASALRKLEGYAHRIPMQVNPAAAQLAIVNPLAGARGGGMLRLFSTHPSTEDRVARLEEIARDPGFARIGG